MFIEDALYSGMFQGVLRWGKSCFYVNIKMLLNCLFREIKF